MTRSQQKNHSPTVTLRPAAPLAGIRDTAMRTSAREPDRSGRTTSNRGGPLAGAGMRVGREHCSPRPLGHLILTMKPSLTLGGGLLVCWVVAGLVCCWFAERRNWRFDPIGVVGVCELGLCGVC